MVLITSDSVRDLAGNQILTGDTEMGLVEGGGEMGACVLVLLGPYGTPEEFHGSWAPSILGSDPVLALGDFTACLNGGASPDKLCWFGSTPPRFAWQSPEVEHPQHPLPLLPPERW